MLFYPQHLFCSEFTILNLYINNIVVPKKEARIFNKQSWTGVERVAREIEEHVA